MKKIRAIVISGVLVLLMVMPAYAAEWKQESDTWRYQNDDGSYAIGWNWINGKSYYFDSSGNMLSSTTTPDGYQVNENGEWVVDGVVQTQSGQTVTSTQSFGSLPDSAAKGYWSNKENLTWTWWDGSGSVVIGNGPKYSDLHPEVTDREALLKEYVNYPGEGLTNLSSWGEPKANYDEETLQLLREFVNSFDWINSDELTRMKAVHDRIAVGNYGNKYGTEGITREYNGWSVLRDKGGICMNYAGEFWRLAQYVGLECVTYSPKVNHEICMVRINGQWITVDPSMEVSFWDNGVTVPVDFDIEYHRVENEFKQSDTYEKVQEENKLEEQYWNGEITYEELQKKVADLYK